MRAHHLATVRVRLIERVLGEEADLVEHAGLGDAAVLDQAAEVSGVLGPRLRDAHRAAGALPRHLASRAATQSEREQCPT
jgi:hypothetical protein